MHHEERTHAYVAKRLAEALSKKETVRCLKRFLAREVYARVMQDVMELREGDVA